MGGGQYIPPVCRYFRLSHKTISSQKCPLPHQRHCKYIIFLGHVCCNTLWRLKEKISKHFVATNFALRMSFSIKLEGDIISFENLMGVKKMKKDTKCSKRCSCFCCYVVSVYKKMSRLQSLQFEGSIRGLPWNSNLCLLWNYSKLNWSTISNVSTISPYKLQLIDFGEIWNKPTN